MRTKYVQITVEESQKQHSSPRKDQDWGNCKTITCKVETMQEWNSPYNTYTYVTVVISSFRKKDISLHAWIVKEERKLIVLFHMRIVRKKSIEFDNWSILLTILLIIDTFQAGTLSFLPLSFGVRLPVKKRLRISHFM